MGLFLVQSSGEGSWFPARHQPADDRGAAEGEEGQMAIVPTMAYAVFHTIRRTSVVQGLSKFYLRSHSMKQT